MQIIPHDRITVALLLTLSTFGLDVYADDAHVADDPGFGPKPQLPEPQSSLIPVVKVAPAKGWAGDETPLAASGLRVNAYAADLDHPRWLYVLPNGDVLVAETNAPQDRPDDRRGLRAWITKR